VVPKDKNYIEWEGIKVIIEEKAMKSKKNQFNTPTKVERKPFKRRDEVTANLIFLCLLSVVLGSAALIGLIHLASS